MFKIELPYDPVSLLLGVYLKERKTEAEKDLYTTFSTVCGSEKAILCGVFILLYNPSPELFSSYKSETLYPLIKSVHWWRNKQNVT